MAKKRKKRTSHIWDVEKGYEVIDVETRKRHYYCCRCIDINKDAAYIPLALHGNSSVLFHWETTHMIDKNGDPIKSSAKELTPQSTFSSSLVSRVSFDVIKLLFIQWIVYCHIAFSQIENFYFQQLLRQLHEGISALIPGRKTIRSWILAEFATRKRQLRHDLRKARSNIHLSFDLWTSPNCHAIIAICAHYIDRHGHPQTKLLAMRGVEGEHTGENLAIVVLKVIREYRVGRRVGFFMLDNAASNDTCVDAILRALYPMMNGKQRRRRRLRCLGHVINLSAQTFLLGRTAERTLDELEIAYLRSDFEKVTTIWRKQGALGRLHNLVRYIRMTPQRRAEFRKIVIQDSEWADFNRLELIQTNATRWNSYFMSIVRALNCRKRIEEFCNTHAPKKGPGIENERLLPHHWILLEKLESSLHPYYEATLCNEGKTDTLKQWFITMDWILDQAFTTQAEFSQLRLEHPDREEYAILETASADAWKKVEEYYLRADESPAYYAAIALDPNTKWSWFRKVWRNNGTKMGWIDGSGIDGINIQAAVQELWIEEYKGKSPLTYQKQPLQQQKQPRHQHPDNRFGGLNAHAEIVDESDISLDEDLGDAFQQFFHSQRLRAHERVDALQYWNSQYEAQPDLAQFALDMLAIPLMSAECERVFSSAKHLLIDARNRLLPDIIEANECLKSWFEPPRPGAFNREDVEAGEKDTADRPAETNKVEATKAEQIALRKELLAANEPAFDESGAEDDEVIPLNNDGEVILSD